jgi:serine/threonine-protein kinase
LAGPSALANALHDRYRLERELGRGGMATVYLARDLKHDRPVALKLLRPELAAILGAERFLREIRLTANLQHPHILSLIDSGEAAGQFFYVMPYVEGESLRQRLQHEGQLPLAEALRLTAEIAEALDYAHQQGIIHRDIKPENILLSRGHALVADFGIALAVTEAGGGRLTETGLSLGTPAYISPEQAMAEPHLDGRTDQYSLGCVLYEMLAGEPPFTGPTPQAIIAKRFAEPVPHLRTVRDVAPALEQVVSRALARTPADRFATVDEFAQALEAARSVVRPATRPLPAGGTTGRRRSRPAIIAAGALLLAAAAIVTWRLGTPRLPISATRLAVLPFSVAAGAELGYLGPGMVDLLSRNLDGAGEIRTIDAPTVIASLRKADVSAGDAVRARQVVHRLGAGQVVQGIISAAGKRLRIQAELLPAAGDSELPLSRASVEGDSTELFALVDRLAAQLLAEKAQGPGFRLFRTAATTTHSLPALKSYLKAEQHFRAVRYDSAIVGFRDALDEDSTFALAYYRLAVAALWGNRSAQIDPALDRAVRLADRLSDRDRALVSALDAFRRGLPDEAERRYRGILRDYPDDLEASAEFAHLLFSYNPLRGRSRAESGDIFRQVVELDPRFFCPI